MSRAVRLMVLMVCVAFLAGAAFADVKNEGDQIRFRVNAWVEYTDNRDSSDDKDDNVDLAIAPRLEAFLQWSERIKLDLFYEPTYRYRDNPSDIQNDTVLFHDLGLLYEHALTRPVSIRVHERLNITDDPSVQEGGATLSRDSSFVLNRLNVGLNYEFSRRANADVEVFHSVKRYDDEQRRQESDESSLGAIVTGFRQTSRTAGWLVSFRAADLITTTITSRSVVSGPCRGMLVSERSGAASLRPMRV